MEDQTRSEDSDVTDYGASSRVEIRRAESGQGAQIHSDYEELISKRLANRIKEVSENYN